MTESCSSRIRRLSKEIQELSPEEIMKLDGVGLILIFMDKKRSNVFMRANLKPYQVLNVIDSCNAIQRSMLDCLADELEKRGKDEPEAQMKVIKGDFCADS